MPAPAPAPARNDAPTAVRPVRPRLAALDAARALGVVAMVVGHTLDATLSPAARQTPAMVRYWVARGFTAPLFLLVSGWAVALAISRSGARGLAVPRGRLRRVGLLLLIGYGLRWPGWGLDRLLSGDREVWAHFLAFDALHCIALALLATSLVLALPGPAWARALLLAGLAGLAVLSGAGAGPAGAPADPATLPRSIPALALAQVVGGSSPFPVVPWAAYFLAGATVAHLTPGSSGRRVAATPALAALVLLALTFPWAGMGTRPQGDPMLIAFRAGVVLAILAGLTVVPQALAARAAPVGRASLGVYALHLPIVYGWSTFPGLAWRIGRTLGAGPALALAAAVLAGSFLAILALRGLASAGRAAAARLWPARPAG